MGRSAAFRWWTRALRHVRAGHDLLEHTAVAWPGHMPVGDA